jgi:tetratricopeptide (TPR) repeat protein
MTRSIANSFGQPSLEDLMVRFLANRSDASSGAVEHDEGRMEPHEVASGFRVDPRAAWTDANDTLTAARPEQPKGGTLPALPTEWATLVAQPSAAFAVAMAAGNFPQRVKDLQPLLVRFSPDEMRPSGTHQPQSGFAGLRAWAVKQTKTNPLLAAGIARLLGDYDLAAERLSVAEPGQERDNELAALLWHRGKCEQALAAWNAMAETPAVLFNRGMASLFLGKPAEAREVLTRAVAGLPENHGWNALARLYLALAEIHG